MVYEEIVISILGVVGIASIITACLTYVFDKRKKIASDIQEVKKERYRATILKMLVLLDPDEMKFAKRPDLKTMDDWKKELHAEWVNALLFGSDDVIKTLKDFLLNPNKTTYAKTVIAIRKDLWNKKTSLKPEEINL